MLLWNRSRLEIFLGCVGKYGWGYAPWLINGYMEYGFADVSKKVVGCKSKSSHARNKPHRPRLLCHLPFSAVSIPVKVSLLLLNSHFISSKARNSPLCQRSSEVYRLVQSVATFPPPDRVWTSWLGRRSVSRFFWHQYLVRRVQFIQCNSLLETSGILPMG